MNSVLVTAMVSWFEIVLSGNGTVFVAPLNVAVPVTGSAVSDVGHTEPSQLSDYLAYPSQTAGGEMAVDEDDMSPDELARRTDVRGKLFRGFRFVLNVQQTALRSVTKSIKDHGGQVVPSETQGMHHDRAGRVTRMQTCAIRFVIFWHCIHF